MYGGGPADDSDDIELRAQTVKVESFKPNLWGLFQVHGNVAEWTRSTYCPYPLIAGNGQDDRVGRKTVRGGSWLDRPRRARSAFRIHYEPSQAVHDVGFRVVCEDATP